MVENKQNIKNIDGSMLVETFAKKWLVEVVLAQSPNTYDDNYSKLKHHIIPYFGTSKLKNITQDKVQELVKYLTTKKAMNKKDSLLSVTTIKHIVNVLSSMMNYAIELKMIKTNPCHDIKYPKGETFEKEVYNVEEIGILINHLKLLPSQNKALYIVLLTTGLRRGELIGLHWKDIDFKNKTVSIKKAYYKTKVSGKVTTKPKSKYSIRTVGLSDLAIECLLEYKKEQDIWKKKYSSEWKSPNVFTDVFGNILSPDAVSSRWTRLVKKIPVKNIRLHDLRASYATYLVYSETPIADISKTMGHSRISTTVDMYVKSYDKYYESARNNINKIR